MTLLLIQTFRINGVMDFINQMNDNFDMQMDFSPLCLDVAEELSYQSMTPPSVLYSAYSVFRLQILKQMTPFGVNP